MPESGCGAGMCLAGCSEHFDLGVAETVRSAATSRSMAKQQLLDHQPRLDRLPQPTSSAISSIVRHPQRTNPRLELVILDHDPAVERRLTRALIGTRHNPRSAQRRGTRVSSITQSQLQVVRRPDLRPHERQTGTRNGRATRTPTRGQPRGSRSTTGGGPRRSAITPGRAAVNPPEATGGRPRPASTGHR
jgi:hypothetical protein